jgi:transposase
VKGWKVRQSGSPTVTQAFVPLAFPPGETCQFDWSHEEVELGGVAQAVKVAHFRLAFQPRMFVAAYPRETQEMVFDAHIRAFAFFGGVPLRMVYDNLKTVVDAIFTGKERQFNRRFLGPGQSLPVRAGGLHAGIGAGKGPGLNLSGERPRVAVHAEAEIRGFHRAECLAGPALP